MAPNKSYTKLDFISEEDLGVSFDPDLVWEKLEHKMGQPHKAFLVRMALVASIALLILLVPFEILDYRIETNDFTENAIEGLVEIEETADYQPELLSRVEQIELLNLKSKRVGLLLANTGFKLTSDSPRTVQVYSKSENQFSEYDISIIQASIKPVEEGKNKSRIQTKIFASSKNLDVEYQTLKIKINEKE